jgi:hypothetical protein
MSDTNVETQVTVKVADPDSKRVWQQYADNAKQASESVTATSRTGRTKNRNPPLMRRRVSNLNVCPADQDRRATRTRGFWHSGLGMSRAA